jgi:hypothetical protein
MIKTIIGMIVFLIPFLLVARFKDKREGFFCVLGLLIAGCLFIALITQALGIFFYFVIMIVFAAFDAALLYKINFLRVMQEVKKIKIDWVFAIVLVIIFICLYCVHNNYTGEIATINGYKDVENMRYLYPYYSDEWIVASLARYSIESGKLPLVTTLWHDYPAANIAFPIYSFAALVSLVFDFDPVSNFYIFPLFSGILICSLVYFILRLNNAGKLSSSVASLSMLYVLNSAILPGIWYFIPITMGVVSLMIGQMFVFRERRNIAYVNFLASFVFYPPLIIFIIPVIVFGVVFKERDIKLARRFVLFGVLALLLAIVLIFLIYNTLKDPMLTWDYFVSKFFYTTVYKNAIPYFPVYGIIPVYLLLFSIVGIMTLVTDLKKRAWILAPLSVGAVLWLFYSFFLQRFFLEYDRVVFVTSIFIVIVSGFGVNCIEERIGWIKKHKLDKILLASVLIAFFVLSFSYTQRDDWKKFDIRYVDKPGSMKAEPPANKYLHEADLELFEGINRSEFLSYSWKGLVVGVATNNYPIVTKSATLTNVRINPLIFYAENCDKKLEIAKKEGLDYVYHKKIDCPGFELIGISVEDLYLYKVNVDA